MEEEEGLTVKLFNGLEISADPGLIPRFASLRAEILIAWLVMHPGQHRRELIASLLWDERDQTRVLGNLRTLLARLPKLVKSFLLITPQTLGSDPDQRIDVDLLEFDRLVSESHYSEAEMLFNGEPLAGVNIAESEGLYEWMVALREEYRQKGINLLQTLAESAHTQGEFGQGILYAQKLVQLDPLREESYHLLMRLLARDGQRGEALNVFTKCKQMLRDEFDLEPQPETVALAERLQSGQRSRYNLPVQPTPFIGRREELAALQGLIGSGDKRLITISGPGGVGKTRLAIQCGDQVAFHFLDGVVFVPLSSVEQPQQVLPTIINSLNENRLIPPLPGNRLPINHLQEHLKYIELLLILDNFEHVLQAKEPLGDLLSQASGLKILATSRVRLGSRWEHLLELQGLHSPKKADDLNWQRYDAVQLFLQAAKRSFPGINFIKEDQNAITRICQQVGSMPLALELAANWLQVYSPAEIADKIEEGVKFLFDSGDELPPRQRSLQAVFDVAWNQLAPAEQAALARISVFRGGFDTRAAISVTKVSDQQLLALANKSLLYKEYGNETNEHVRYSLHPLLREFAWEKLAAEPQRLQDTRTGHAGFYLQQVAAFDTGKWEDNLHLDRFVVKNIDNVRVAWNWAIEQSLWPLLMSASDQMFKFYDRNGLNQEGINSFELAAQAASQQQSMDVRYHFHLRKYSFFERIGNYEEAIEEIKGILSEFRNEVHPVVAELFVLCGELLYEQSSYALASEKLELGLEMATELQLELTIAEANRILSQIAAEEGQYDLAESIALKAFALYERIEHTQGLAWTLNLLAAIARINENYATAIRRYRRSIELCEVRGENQTRLFILRNLSLALGRIGQLDEALRDADEALAGFAEYGSISGRASTLYIKGVLTTKMGRYRWAEQLFKTSLQLNKQATQMKRQWFLSTQLAMLYENWGRPLLALYFAREALNLTTEEKDRYTKRTVQTALGYALIGKGKAQEAKAAFQEALTYTDGIGTSKAVVELEAGIIEAEMLGGDVEKAGQLALLLIPHLTPEVVPACLQPFRVYLTAYRALREYEPNLAQELLAQALELMEKWEKSIPDERSWETFRTAVPAHRALLEYGGRLETGA